MHTVNWYDCVKWCNARSEQEGLTPVYYTDDAQTTVYKTGEVSVTNAQVKWTCQRLSPADGSGVGEGSARRLEREAVSVGQCHLAILGELLRLNWQLRFRAEWLQSDWRCGRHVTSDESGGIVCGERLWAL